MTYSALLNDEGAKSNFLISINPKVYLNEFTLFLDTGTTWNVWVVDFQYDSIIEVNITADANVLSLKTLAELETGLIDGYYFDSDLMRLYITSPGFPLYKDPNDNVVIVTYGLYLSTQSVYWHSDPLDTASDTVYWDGLISETPAVSSTTSDVLFGFLPSQSATFVVQNDQNAFQKHVFKPSYSNAEVKIYHWLGDIKLSNIILFMDGFITQVTYDQKSVSFKMLDPISLFEEQVQASNNDLYLTFPNINPSFYGEIIRKVFGVADGFLPVNVDFEEVLPTTTNNRLWSAIKIGASDTLANVTSIVPASPASTPTRTYVTSAQGFRTGDSVWIDRPSGTDEYATITNVNYASNYIEHESLSGFPADPGDSVKRSFIGSIDIVKNGVHYYPMYGRDYVNYSFGSDIHGFQFASGVFTGLEAHLAMPSNLSPNDRVTCRIYGPKNNETISAAPFGTNDSESGNLAAAPIVLYRLLKDAGLSESDINTSSFIALLAETTEAIGIAIPKTAHGNSPTYKDVIIDICKTIVARIYRDNDRLWKVTRAKPTSVIAKTIDDSEIILDAFQYNWDYSDMVTTVILEYAFREIAANAQATVGNDNSTLSTSNSIAQALHGIQKIGKFTSLHFKETDAQVLANKLSVIFGSPKGILKIQSKLRMLDTLISDEIAISRSRMPGVEFNSTENVTRNFVAIETSRGLRSIDIILDEQRGIEDNPSAF